MFGVLQASEASLHNDWKNLKIVVSVFKTMGVAAAFKINIKKINTRSNGFIILPSLNHLYKAVLKQFPFRQINEIKKILVRK